MGPGRRAIRRPSPTEETSSWHGAMDTVPRDTPAPHPWRSRGIRLENTPSSVTLAMRDNYTGASQEIHQPPKIAVKLLTGLVRQFAVAGAEEVPGPAQKRPVFAQH